MSIRDDIESLKDRSLKRLNHAHDYFNASKRTWRLLSTHVTAETKFSIKNEVTGSVTTFAELVDKSEGYISKELAEASFQQFIAIFEFWFFDLLRIWLAAYPQRMASRQLTFGDILEAPDNEAITQLVIDKELNELTYKKTGGLVCLSPQTHHYFSACSRRR